MTIILTNNNLNQNDLIKAKKDLEGISAGSNKEGLHTIRGRLIHNMTILERIIREKVTNYDLQRYNSPRTDFYNMIDVFSKKLRDSGNYSDITEIESKLQELRDLFRNPWAHGLVFYESFEEDNQEEKPINKLDNKGNIIDISFNSDPNHFDNANELFKYVFQWLFNNQLLTINGYNIKII